MESDQKWPKCGEDPIVALVGAAWSVLDDMGDKGQCCCLASKAELRIAIEPFLDAFIYTDPDLRDAIMSLNEAREILG